ncbi:MAG: AAA family ATPase [Bacteroidales bacterium]|nr:AAA family ATPase [Bacteroidales bacterium]
MRLLRLEIKNLASLDNPDGEVIDFESGVLGASDIFSIVGPTGSGKSTILDAICLPLYNRTPRYTRSRNERVNDYQVFGVSAETETTARNRISRHDGRNILSRGKREGWSKITFRANDGAVYRAEWSVVFRRVNYDKALTTLYRIEADGTETPKDWNTLPEIIGLDFNQFLRTVLIAQGSFAEFLNSEEKDRMILLERLIGAQDKFTPLAEGITDGRKKAAERVAALEARLEADSSALLSSAQLEELLQNIGRLEEEKALLDAEKKSVEEALGWYTTDTNLELRIAEAEKQRQEAEKTMADRDADVIRLDAYGMTEKGRGLVTEIDKIRRESGDMTRDLENMTKDRGVMAEELLEGEKILTSCRQQLAEARKRREEENPKILRATELKSEEENLRKNLSDEETRARKIGRDIRKVEKLLKETRADLEALSERRNKLEAELKSEEKADKQKEKEMTADLAALREVLEETRLEASRYDDIQLRNESEISMNRRSAIEKILNLSAELDSAQKEQSENAAGCDTLRKEITSIDKNLSGLKVEELDNEVRILGETYALMTGEQWDTQRTRLKEGSPCPLCGSVHHPYASEEVFAPVADEMSGMIKRKKIQLAGLRDKERELRDKKSVAEGKMTVLISRLEADRRRIAKLSEELAGVTADYPDYKEKIEQLPAIIEELKRKETELAESLTRCSRLRTLVDKKAKETDEKSKKLELFRKEMAEKKTSAESEIKVVEGAITEKKTVETGYITECGEKNKQQTESAERVRSLQDAADEKRRAISAEIGEKQPDAYSKELDEEVDKKNAEVEKCVANLAALREKIGRTEGSMEKTRNHISRAEEDIRRLSEELSVFIAALCADSLFSLSVDEEYIRRLAYSEENWEALRAELLSLRDRVTASRAALSAECRALEQHHESRPSRTREELDSRLTEIEKADFSELEKLRVRRRAAEEARERVGKYAEEREKAIEELNDWKELQEAIGTDGMRVRKIAQCYTLGFLIDHANAEIRRFNSRYELVQVKNSLDIRIIDHERADDIRDTTSLSGGETFIVSLGLALGLSALSSRNVSFDNLFIDEGFGSLDGDTLATVIESLSMLQSSRGKKVGVISHTDLMSERIPTQIRVVKQGGTGSSRLQIHS